MTEFPLPKQSGAAGIVTGPDRALWFAEYFSNQIGRITTTGDITQYAVPTSGSGPIGITDGPNGTLWFTEYNTGIIGRITTSGAVSEFPLPSSSSAPSQITTGTPGGFPAGITVGPGPALWFTEEKGGKIGKITLDGAITEFPVPLRDGQPSYITSAPDGALWFTAGWSQGGVGWKTTSGTTLQFYLTPSTASGPGGITAGPGGVEGDIWFTEQRTSKIARIPNCAARNTKAP